MTMQIHPTAIIEDGVDIGEGTAVWDSVHVRSPATIGSDCIIGEKSYIAYGVKIGDRVKINARVYVCTGIVIEDGVMLSAGVTFTNDRFPRATTPDLGELRPSDPDEHTLMSTVGEGTTIGAGAVIGPGIDIGRFAMIGMGSVVTRPVGDFEMVTGNPATLVGYVCRCGPPILRHSPGAGIPPCEIECTRCGRGYRLTRHGVEERP